MASCDAAHFTRINPLTVEEAPLMQTGRRMSDNVGPPMSDARTMVCILAAIFVFLFIGTWAMFGGMMVRMAEYDDHLAKTLALEAEIATMRQQFAVMSQQFAVMSQQFQTGPLSPGGALVRQQAISLDWCCPGFNDHND
jgi:hypothetical protein